MANDPLVPFALEQNPAPNPVAGQAALTDRAALVVRIMDTFRQILPSNYVAQVNGPWYSLQFQAMVEQLADAQITATEVYRDAAFDFTRPDFLYQVLGVLVFPTGNIPTIDGDTSYRTFLKKMVGFLLDGAKASSMKGGIEALNPDLVVELIENYLDTPPRNPVGAFTIEDQFGVQIYATTETGNAFVDDPTTLAGNIQLVLEALKPAHVIYSYSYLFTDLYAGLDDENGLSMALSNYYYDDARKYCGGAEAITSSSGVVLTNRTLFSDTTLSFEAISPGAVLTVTAGANTGTYTVQEILFLLGGTDATPRAYTTSPTGLAGLLTAVEPNTLIDTAQDWGLAVEGETITITGGRNAGTYRLDTVLGLTGGAVGQAGVSGTRVRISPCVLRLDRRLPVAGSGNAYTVTVDRLGVRTPRIVVGEDVSAQCYS